MCRALHSALESDQRIAVAYRKTVDAEAADDLFLCKQNTLLKNLFDAAWKFNCYLVMSTYPSFHPARFNRKSILKIRITPRLRNDQLILANSWLSLTSSIR
jgi:hypothetical protein